MLFLPNPESLTITNECFFWKFSRFFTNGKTSNFLYLHDVVQVTGKILHHSRKPLDKHSSAFPTDPASVREQVRVVASNPEILGVALSSTHQELTHKVNNSAATPRAPNRSVRLAICYVVSQEAPYV